MRSHAKAPTAGSHAGTGSRLRLVLFAFALLALTIALGGGISSAALSPHKEAIDAIYNQSSPGSLGGQFSIPRNLAVNRTNGRLYVVDDFNERIQRFGAAGDFERAWGKNVVQTGGSGDTVGGGFEICTVASQCRAGEESGENGAMAHPMAIAIDEDTGDVYVSDRNNRRVNEYDGDGGFIRSFGWDVVESGPDEAGSGYEICEQSAGDVCKAGLEGAGVGQIGATFEDSSSGLAVTPPDGNATSGKLYLADTANSRVLSYGLDGTSPAGFGSSADFESEQPRRIAIDANGILYASNSLNGAEIERYDTGAATFLEPITAEDSTPAGPLKSAENPADATQGLAVDAANHLYVMRRRAEGVPSVVQQFNTPGQAAQPAAEDDHHGEAAGFESVRGLAVNASTGRLYIAAETALISTGNQRIAVYLLDYVEPPEATIEPITEFDATGATFEGEIDPNGSPTGYRFEFSSDGGSIWSCTTVFDCSDPSNLKDAGKGTAPVAVSVDFNLLTPDTTYEVRLRAIKPFGAGEDLDGPSPATTIHTPAIPPTVITGYAAPIGTTTARLTGSANPNNSPTDVHFEYGLGDCQSNPCQSTPPQSIGSEYVNPGFGQPFPAVSADLTGLQPATTYHYRLVGKSGVGAVVNGADRTFTTLSGGAAACLNEDVRAAQHTFYLPDCRGIELVNRADKGPQHVTVESFNSRDGNPFTPDGEKIVWTTPAGTPGGAAGTLNTFLASRTPGGWQSQTPVPPAPQQVGGGTLKYALEGASEGFTNFIYRTEEAGFAGGLKRGTYVRVNRDREQEVLGVFQNNVSEVQPVDLSADAARVLHLNRDQQPTQLEDIGDPGHSEVVGLMPDGSEPICGIDQFQKGASLPSAAPGYHWVSADGSRVYFQSRGDECEGPLGLYVRIREAPEETVKIADHASLIRTTPSGRSAFFTTAEALTGEDLNSHQDVYRWNEGVGSTCLTCVVPDANLLVYNGNRTRARISNDFSHVYFESKSQLIPGRGTEGDSNLYVFSEGEIHFALDLSVASTEQGALFSGKLSDDGNVFTFLTEGRPTSDAIAAECVDAATGTMGPCEELYRYDDRDGSVECLSCLHGATTTESVQPANAQLSTAFTTSADGSTALFSTRQALLLGDVNDGFDIYAWRNGTLGLITDGVTEYPGAYAAPTIVGVDADGSDAFFRVADPGLTGFERDSVDNLYDARIGGGFIPPSPPPACDGDACQGPLQAAPPIGRSASSAFSGNGNLKTRSARKGSCSRKHGKARKRCIRKHKRQAQKARAKANARSGK